MRDMRKSSSNEELLQKPSRELDILVAEKVFGLAVRNTFTGSETPITSGVALQHMDRMSRVPHFSTNIADAWLVVNKLGGGFDLSCDHGLPIRWTVDWTISLGEFIVPTAAVAETPELAICLCALKAVEAK